VILLRLFRRGLVRRPGRTALTAGGAAAALALLVLTGSMASGVDRALGGSRTARTLVVYRQNRYCPQTSFLPLHYAERIARVPGVASVLPVRVFLNNCRASLDLVTFQGAPPEELLRARGVTVVAGDAGRFVREKDAALLGRSFAARKGLSPGDRFRFGGIDVDVAGVFSSDEPTEEGLVFTHLDFLQRAGPSDRLGAVTQFEVLIDDAARAPAIARTIDELFASAEAPVDTRAKAAFLEAATKDLRSILRFAGALALACALTTLALVANAVAMSAAERAREFAVLRTLGYGPRHVFGLVLGEGAALSLLGGGLGVLAAAGAVRLSGLTFGAEGVPVAFASDPRLVSSGLAAALAAGVIGGFVPAWRAARLSVVRTLRER
jgi:putative ABC transport system permease protein